MSDFFYLRTDQLFFSRADQLRNAARKRRFREADVYAQVRDALPLPLLVKQRLDKGSLLKVVMHYLKTQNIMNSCEYGNFNLMWKWKMVHVNMKNMSSCVYEKNIKILCLEIWAHLRIEEYKEFKWIYKIWVHVRIKTMKSLCDYGKYEFMWVWKSIMLLHELE